MNDVFFGIKQSRRSRMLRKDKNHDSVLPLKPMTFLVNRNPTVLPERSAMFSKRSSSDKSDLSVRYLTINFISLHQTNLM